MTESHARRAVPLSDPGERMGMSAGGHQGGPKSDINVTPLVDVVLVLLIIFMVITPMLQRGKAVELPKAQEIEKPKTDGKDDSIILSVTPDKKIYLENDQMDEKAPARQAARWRSPRTPAARCCSRATTRSRSRTCAR